jgi:hypothetical protein
MVRRWRPGVSGTWSAYTPRNCGILQPANFVAENSVHVGRPLARADETTDYINQIYADQAAQNSYMEQLQQTQDYINQIYQDQAAQNDYMQQLQQTQDYINQINSIGQNQ